MEREHKITIARSAISFLLLAITWSIAEFFLDLPTHIEAILFLIPYIIISYDIIFKAFKNICKAEIFDECFLMTVASIGAIIIGEYPEATAVMLFYQIGEMFQDIAIDKSRDSINALMEIRPETATVIRNNNEIIVPPEEVEIGETIIIKVGERIPLDGIITAGTSSIDTSAITGEAIPTDVSSGTVIKSGSINLTGVLKVRTTSIYKNSTVAKIIELTENAKERKAKVDGFITRFARIYTPCVVIAALLVAFVPSLFFEADLYEWINRALIFLVVSCPCALVISVPLSFYSGLGAAARNGILIKGSVVIEQLAKCNTFLFDKTGTLTEGKFTVDEIQPYNCDKNELIHLAVAAESSSNHPIAKSITEAFGQSSEKINDIKEIAGKGIIAVLDGKTLKAGNAKLVKIPNEIVVTQSGTTIHIEYECIYKGYISVKDAVKPSTREAIKRLSEVDKARCIMLTGDNEATAKRVSEEIGISDYYHSLLPENKAEIIEKINTQNDVHTAFIGDGINDSPALATATVGIAMGIRGSDAAIENADAVIMNDSLIKVAEVRRISERTVKIARQNIIFSLAVKGIIMLTGALGITGMWFAVFADVGVTFIAIINATRMLKK